MTGMAYIFLDESGDLGFDFSKAKTSKYFVITFLFVKSKKPIEKIVKRVFQKFNKADRKHHPGVLHCFKEMDSTRHDVLNKLKYQDISVVSIHLNKKKVYTKLQDEKHVLYNYVANILLDRIYNRGLIPINQPIYLIASQRETNKFLNANFKTYITRKVQTTYRLPISIEIKKPKQEKCLQIVDFVCWAIYQKHEYEKAGYYDIIKDKVVEDNPLFP